MPPADTEYLGYVGHPELPHGYYPYLGRRPDQRKDWLATASVAAGVVLLFPVAITLGHLSLRAVRNGESGAERRAKAGLVIGYGVAAAVQIAYLAVAAHAAMTRGAA
ncbi:DUF4190 domain-containing protein [Demequina mangrovi]|uniref:DUF4190 domain-containing protein n=1 Tax=Demequina mangrovi TaxID=1043493 RepID=A0A1H6X7K1_9MICO|nr:DUF4190 domain-containing protein [Demequina mangrovi]SEJ25129.1 hypothetical protein SAMN05421637_1327 [Demequina mangrovi]